MPRGCTRDGFSDAPANPAGVGQSLNVHGIVHVAASPAALTSPPRGDQRSGRGDGRVGPGRWAGRVLYCGAGVSVLIKEPLADERGVGEANARWWGQRRFVVFELRASASVDHLVLRLVG